MLRTTGRRPRDYEEYRVPPALQYLWDAFWELDRSRNRSMGCAPISEQELYFWQKNTGYKLLSWERSAILKMDIAYCEEMAKHERD